MTLNRPITAGGFDQVGAVEIHWPDGQVEKLQLQHVDRIYTIQEAHGILTSYSSRK
jgi:hypothetical protein